MYMNICIYMSEFKHLGVGTRRLLNLASKASHAQSEATRFVTYKMPHSAQTEANTTPLNDTHNKD